MEQQSCNIIILCLLFLNILRTSTSNQNYYFPRSGHSTIYTTFTVPSLDKSGVNFSPVTLSNFPKYDTRPSYVPYTPSTISELKLHETNVFKKPGIPTHQSPTGSQSTATKNVFAAQPSIPQISHHPIVYNLHHEQPLTIAHPTIQVPKAFSQNPPKYIQILQFPKVLRPLQPLKSVLSSNLATPGSTKPTFILADHKPFFSAQKYTMVNDNSKPVSPVVFNIDNKEKPRNVSEATNLNQFTIGSPSLNKINSFEIVYHDWNKDSKKPIIALPSPTETAAPAISKLDAVMQSSLTNFQITENPRVQTPPSIESNLLASRPFQDNSQAEIDLSELLETFSFSKLTNTDPTPTNQNSSLLVTSSSTVENTYTESTIPAITTTTTENSNNIRSTEKPEFNSQKSVFELDSYLPLDSQVTTFRPLHAMDHDQEMKIRSLLYRINPSFSLLEKYSKTTEPESIFQHPTLLATTLSPLYPSTISVGNNSLLLKEGSLNLESSSEPVTAKLFDYTPYYTQTEKVLKEENLERKEYLQSYLEILEKQNKLSKADFNMPNKLVETSDTTPTYEIPQNKISNSSISDEKINSVNDHYNYNSSTSNRYASAFKNNSLSKNTTLSEPSNATQLHGDNIEGNFGRKINVKASKITESIGSKHQQKGINSKKLMKRKIRLVVKPKPEDGPSQQALKRRIYLKVQSL